MDNITVPLVPESGSQSGTVYNNIELFEFIINCSRFVSYPAFGIQLHTYFYPTALKICLGIVFIHGVWMGGREFDGKSLSALYLRTIRCRKMILFRDIG